MNALRHLFRSPFAVVVFASTLWIVGGASRSLWIDELHSLQHARQPTVELFLASVADDNHPPLAWLLLRTTLAAFGDGELAMRSWAILVGLAFLAVTTRAARFLPEALDSVLAQTYEDREVIVADDASTDDTPAVLER